MKNVLITGCADGIGLAVAEKFIKKGFRVYGFDVKTPKADIDFDFRCININDIESVQNYLLQIPNMDYIVNNAAIQVEKRFLNQTLSEIDSVINTNLISLIKFTQMIIPKLNDKSIIFNIGSIHSEVPRLNKLPYDVSKAGLDMLTKELALELAPKTRVIGVNIGATITPMNDNFKNSQNIISALSKIPLKHIFKPSEIAKVIYELSLPAFRFMTGSIIIYDGGRSLV